MESLEYIATIRNYLKHQFSLGDEQINIMLPDFITTLEGHMDKLENALQSGDLESLGKSGHTMKGALVNLGFHQLAELAYQIEESGKKGDDTLDYSSIIKTLRVTVDQISLAGKK
jgi:histidine phosphotransfer protein HptB